MKNTKAKDKKGKGRKAIIICFIVLVLVILAGIFTVVCREFVNVAGEKRLLYYEYEESLDSRDYIIVPGAGVKQGMPSYPLRTRLDRAIQLYEEDIVSFILISGGSDETPVMHKYLLERNVPNADIQVDQFGIDTYDTISRANETFEEKSFYFTTQEQYAGRPAYIIDRLGLDADCVNSDLVFYLWEKEDIVREYFAKTKAVFDSAFIKAKPKYSVVDYPIITGEMNEKNIDYSDNPHNFE